MRENFILQALTEGSFSKDMLSAALLFRGKWQKRLFMLAREKRKAHFPERKVEMRSVIEVSNICQRGCNFCSINFYSRIGKRYIIQNEELMEQVRIIYSRGRRVILIQSGENRSQKYIDSISKCVVAIKRNFSDLRIILCLGSLRYEQYAQLHAAGADRYILKFETSNPKLYKQIKPDETLQHRVSCLNVLHNLGFEVGSGNIIGLPNQTINDIVSDLFFLGRFNLSMMSASVFIPGESSRYRNKPKGDCDITLNYMALMRMLYPQASIPCVSALEAVKKNGQYLGLMAGANTVTIHDGTPEELKKYFPIYTVLRFTPTERHIRNIVAKAGLFFDG